MNTKQIKKLMKLENLIQKDFFEGNPVFFKREIEGQELTDNGCYLLGCRAGPSVSMSNLFHEMGHLADRDIPKLLKYPGGAWGYSLGKYWSIAGKSGFEPQTDASVQTEMRCWAYQWSIIRHYGNPNKENLNTLVSSSVYLPAFIYYKSKKIPREEKMDYDEREKTAVKIMEKEVLKMSKSSHTFEIFCNEWEKRMIALKLHPNPNRIVPDYLRLLRLLSNNHET